VVCSGRVRWLGSGAWTAEPEGAASRGRLIPFGRVTVDDAEDRRGSGCRPVRGRPFFDATRVLRAKLCVRVGSACSRCSFLRAGFTSASCASSNYGGLTQLTCLQHAQGDADHPDGYDGMPTVRLPHSVEVGDHASVIVRTIRRHAGEPQPLLCAPRLVR
jgi:hypothetical protein